VYEMPRFSNDEGKPDEGRFENEPEVEGQVRFQTEDAEDAKEQDEPQVEGQGFRQP
jgi:hypothetical protein